MMLYRLMITELLTTTQKDKIIMIENVRTYMV